MPTPAPSRDDELLELVKRTAADVAALRQEVSALRARPPEPADEAQTALLHAIATASAGRSFSVTELLAHALVSAPLRAAITASVGALNGRRLGRMLRRIEGGNIGGLSVVRYGADSLGVVWCIVTFAPENP